MSAGFEAVIGLEVHVQLRTRTKLFCRCLNRFGAPANTLVCPVCLGLPGALPVLNAEALRLALRAAWALEARIHPESRFERKHYFYPDLPKGYQISQYDRPYATGGAVVVADAEGRETRVPLRRIHLEEDAGKLLHREGWSGVDLNRAGVPLLEIVTEPVLRSPAAAHAFLSALKLLLRTIGVSDCNMEEGSLRVDANVSVRPRGKRDLGTKVELKNLNSFRFVLRGLEHEIQRQAELLARGEAVARETRLFDPATGRTRPMRGKEEEEDYRYFPEPDLPPLRLTETEIAAARAELPELPHVRRRRLRDQYGLAFYDARLLVEDPEGADYFEAVVRAGAQPKEAANWVLTEVKRLLRERQVRWAELPVTPERLAELIALKAAGRVTGPQAKALFEAVAATGRSPAELAREQGLSRLTDEQALEPVVREAAARFPRALADLRRGKAKARAALVGHVMKVTQGRADPAVVNRLIDRLLAED